MSNLTACISIPHGSPIWEYLPSPVLCWPAFLPLAGTLWCCAPGDVASPSRWWLIALVTPQVRQCMGLHIEKNPMKLLMCMNYFWLGPKQSLGWTKLRAGPQDSLGRWCSHRQTPNTRQKDQTVLSKICRSLHTFSCFWTEKWILVLGSVQCLAILGQ